MRLKWQLSRTDHRPAMLKRVRYRWITCVLEERMGGAPRIDLAFTLRADAAAPRRLPVDATVSQTFATVGERLLVLGPPGAGKTIALLELLRDLLDHAEQDPQQRIPVVFTLSSWARRRLPLADWLVEELHDSYDVPRLLAQDWVSAGRVLPLLDGLDEVAPAARAECVTAINGFLDDYFGGLAVCSRTQDYDTLPTRLRLRDAIELHPPTRQQVRAYLDTVGAPLADLRRTLGADDSLWELVESPLMLDIVARTYQGRPADGLRTSGVSRKLLFAEYVEQMFTRRPITAGYTESQARHWLASLARSMRDHNQSELHLDRLQPDWLPTPVQQRRVITLAALAVVLLGLAGGLLVGLVAGLIAERALDLANGPLIGMAGGLIGGLIAALLAQASVDAAGSRTYGPPVGVDKVWWSWSGLAAGLTVALALGPTGIGAGWPFAVFSGMLIAQLVAHMRGRGAGSSAPGNAPESHPAIFRRGQELAWSWSALGVAASVGLAFGVAGGLRAGLAFGLLTGLAVVLANMRLGRPEAPRWSWSGVAFGLGAGLSAGLGPRPVLGLSVGVAGGLIYGLLAPRMGGQRVDDPAPAKGAEKPPWSWRTLLAGLFFGIIFAQTPRLLEGSIDVLVFGLVTGVLAGLIGPRMSGRQAPQPIREHDPAGAAPPLLSWPNQLFILFCGLAFALVLVVYALAFTRMLALLGGVIGMLLLGLAIGLLTPRIRGRPASPPLALIFGLVFGFALARSPWLLFGLLVLPLGLIWRPFFNAMEVWANESTRWDQPEEPRKPIEPVEEVRMWPWPLLLRDLINMLLLIGLGVGSAITAMGHLPGAEVGASDAWLFGLISVSLSVLLVVTVSGRTRGMADRRTTPNEGIHRSARYSIVFGLTYGISGGLALGPLLGLLSSWALFGTSSEPTVRRAFELAGGGFCVLLFGLVSGLGFGGSACLRHCALRWLLVRNGVAPWRYVGFLDDMADRRFLLKSGSGYLFIHRMLLDHFASEQSPAVGRPPWPAPPDDHDRAGEAR